jgi:threonine 3-dehydrogenase
MKSNTKICMKALVFNKSKTDWDSSRGFELANIPEPVLGAGDEEKVILKVHYAGVCGTDKGIWNRQAFKDAILNSIEANLNAKQTGEGGAKPYRIIGHEFFGEVIKTGSNVKNIKPGDFVTCESHVVCNKCFQCLNGQKNVCINEKILGISVDGGFAEYAKVPAQVVWKTDTSKIRPEVAAMQEPFGNAVHAASKVGLKGKTVAIFGLGPIGMFLTLIVKGLGASSIIGIEPNPIAEDMAKKLGIDYVIPLNPRVIASEAKQSNQKEKIASSDALLAMTYKGKPYARNQEAVDEIKKITNGLGVDVAFEMAGFNNSVNNAIAAVRRGGEVILFGLKNGDFVLEDYNRLVMKGITMHCVAGRQVWETWETTRRLMEDIGNGVQEKLFNVILDRGNGTILPISEYNKEKFEEMMARHPKFLIQF